MSLATRTQGLFDRLKNMPEQYINGRFTLKPDAGAAWLDLRKVIELEILPALHRREQEVPAPTQAIVEAGWEVLDREGIEAPSVEVMEELYRAMNDAR